MPMDDREDITIAVHAEKIRNLTERMVAAERKIWGAVVSLLGIILTIASEILKVGVQ